MSTTSSVALVYRDLVPMEPFGDRHDKLIPDESLVPSHYAQVTSDVPGLPGTLQPADVAGPDVKEPQSNTTGEVPTAAEATVGSVLSTSSFGRIFTGLLNRINEFREVLSGLADDREWTLYLKAHMENVIDKLGLEQA